MHYNVEKVDLESPATPAAAAAAVCADGCRLVALEVPLAAGQAPCPHTLPLCYVCHDCFRSGPVPVRSRYGGLGKMPLARSAEETLEVSTTDGNEA